MSLSDSKCDYWIEKGIPKSGTTWLMNILLKIQRIINKKHTKSNSPLFHIFKRMPETILTRHDMGIMDDIEDQTILKRFSQLRVCIFIVFRDERDRLLSYAHHAQPPV